MLEDITSRLNALMSRLVVIWQRLSQKARIVVIAYFIVLTGLPLTLWIYNHFYRTPKDNTVKATPAPAKPVTEDTTNKVPEKIVINSAEQALAAEEFEDDPGAKVEIKSNVSEPEMIRVANNWLVPQVEQLERQFKSLQKSVEKDETYIEINEPLLEPSKATLKQAEEDYRRTSAALDLPSLPGSSFSEEMNTRYDNARAKLEKVRKQTRLIEEGISAAKRRLETDKSSITEMEVELNTMRDRLAKVRNSDYKTLATTYQYAVSGLKTVPLLRFAGRGSWEVRYIGDISRAFENRFRRNMPISALGQSETHNRLGWDHSHAADVPIHPGSLEGQWLLNYLKDRNIPFLAFRTAMSGVSTGPHFHIGNPSHRLRR